MGGRPRDQEEVAFKISFERHQWYLISTRLLPPDFRSGLFFDALSGYLSADGAGDWLGGQFNCIWTYALKFDADPKYILLNLVIIQKLQEVEVRIPRFFLHFRL